MKTKISVLGCGRWGSFHAWHANRIGCGTLLWGPADPGKVFAVRADAAAEGSSVVSGPYVPAGADALFDVASDRLLALEGAKRYVQTKASAAQLTAVTYGAAITTSAWTELTVNGGEITPASGDTVARVVEVDAANKPIAMGDAVLNIG